MIVGLGDDTIVVGLSEENLTRMRAGAPVVVDARKQCGYQVIIFHGQSEDDLARIVREATEGSATVHDLRSKKPS